MPTQSLSARRINRGRNHSYALDGDQVDGVTTIISNGIPKPALTNWAARTVAEHAADNLELLSQLDRAAIVDLLKGAPWRDRDAAARRGTEVHSYAERLAAGEEVDVPDEITGHVDSYLAFLADFDVDPVLLESVVGHRTHRWMGTLDLVADLNGRRWLLDIKTTRSGIFAEVGLQLAAYRHAEFYLDADGEEQPMIPVDAAGAVWVRADGYDLIEVDASDAIYRTFRHAQQVAFFQRETSKHVVGETIRPGGAA